MASGGLLASQPAKVLWTVGALIINAIKLPLWILYYISSSNRQHPQWSLRQAVSTQALRSYLWHCSFMHVQTPWVVQAKGKEKGRLVPMKPSSKKDVYGGICDDKEIKPATICGYWYPSTFDANQDKGKKVVLHFHGGAYVIGDCRPAESGYAAEVLTKQVGKTLMVSYRLASNPGGRFPAALQDAVSAFEYLLSLGVEHSDIVVSGDSAGGNLVIALLRHLATTDAPGPAAALLWSPWTDLVGSLEPETMIYSPKRFTDYVTPNFADWGAHALCPKDAPVRMDDGWISPASHPFRSKTPIWIQGSGQEVLFKQIAEFANTMKRIAGNKISFHVEEVATHDIILVGNLTGFEEEAENSARVAAKWMENL
jgi:acetyl esterase/lipase